MTNFQKGQKVVKIYSIAGSRTATLTTISKVSKKGFEVSDSALVYDKETGMEINPVIPSCFSEIIILEE